MKIKSDEKSSVSSLLLATGSADNAVYLFDVGTKEGKSELVQKLEGHTHMTYGVSFHPHEHLLASCSADAKIKLWKSKK